ncbi:inositol monophosphatase [Candidatus Saccharibacteria bacterium]|nr:inositol monophosphatase [Candidatus Saccharibacteria bacterium]
MFDKELQVAKDIALMAGKIMLEYFDGDQQKEHKDDGTDVTIADKKINSMAIEELTKHFDYGIVGEEESTAEYGDGYRWFCDPIDGTKAFVMGVPTSMFSLGLVIDGQPVLGVAYSPFLDKLYYGVRGNGSYCNDKKLQVSKESGLEGNFVAITSHLEDVMQDPIYVENLIKMGARPNSFCGAVYKGCLVASGKFVGYSEPGTHAHDVAAIQVIIEEAGGKVTGLDGKPFDYTKPFRGVIASNEIVHEEILRALK